MRRRINLLCGRALLGAWATGRSAVNRAVVDKAAAEVFGPDAATAPRAGVSASAYALGGLGVLAGAAVAGVLVWTTQQANAPLRAAAVPAAPAAVAPLVPTSAPSRMTPMAQAPVVAVEALLAQAPRDINVAWRELAIAWKLPANDDHPCQVASARQVQCHRAGQLTVPQLRRLGRPGILTLQAGKEPPVYALLTGLTEQTATLQLAANQYTVRLVDLGRLWQGDFATYWRAPPGYAGRLAEGSSGPVVGQLARQLSQLDGVPAPSSDSSPPSLDAALRERVRAFQRAQGLNPDGRPGPLTLMQLDGALGSDEPRLQTNTP